ncbi:MULTISPECIES: hypothetical protein [unclassified Neorhizobium]|uniref:hypothetical protein n=1 Tax=unclassified Neorhizobium TaxID=2629175 RepID=UPI001FF4AF00|nr:MULTISPECIES: hypothetical protein [unclassified Neorhizobium]MCJ9668542.1 hypothetical protein [Neorhizobium sp. SHOUNA12B]MCJ9744245.1 hypothetical protein [Neorhizobium sp. SHOUNA12A]
MALGGLLNVMISLAFMYLVLSLICTTVNELVATVLKLRSRSLSVAVTKILADQALIAVFYRNGLITGSISASQRGSVAQNGIPSPAGHSSYIDSKNFAMALLASLNPQNPIPGIKEIEETISKLPDSGMRDVIGSALATANGDIVKLRNGLAEWFDTAMDRLTGEYKRQLRYISLAVGVLIAIVLNADSFAVSARVWKDTALQQAVVSAAETFLASAPAACPVQVAAEGEDASIQHALSSSLDCQLKTLTSHVERLRPLPLGWSADNLPQSNEPNPSLWWGLKIVGWLLTGLALSLGAPLWFDILAKFISIRGTGEKPGKTAEQA